MGELAAGLAAGPRDQRGVLRDVEGHVPSVVRVPLGHDATPLLDLHTEASSGGTTAHRHSDFDAAVVRHVALQGIELDGYCPVSSLAYWLE